MNHFRIVFLLCGCLLSAAVSAQDFSFTDTQGKLQRLADYRGKWVLVNFWATWCPPCQQETPDLVAMHNAQGDFKIAVIGVALDSNRAGVAKFASQFKINYPLVIGSYTMAELQVGPVDALPTSYLYDPSGKLVSYQEGMVTRAEIEKYITLKTKKK
jgi:peroxiredoxin